MIQAVTGRGGLKIAAAAVMPVAAGRDGA